MQVMHNRVFIAHSRRLAGEKGAVVVAAVVVS